MNAKEMLIIIIIMVVNSGVFSGCGKVKSSIASMIAASLSNPLGKISLSLNFF